MQAKSLGLWCVALSVVLAAGPAVAKPEKKKAPSQDSSSTSGETKDKASQDLANKQFTDKYAGKVVFAKSAIDPTAAPKPATFVDSFTGKDSIYAVALLPKRNTQLGLGHYSIAIYEDDHDYPREKVDLSWEGWDTNYVVFSVLPSLSDKPDARALYQATQLCRALAYTADEKHTFTVKVHPFMPGPETDTRTTLAEARFSFDGTADADAIRTRCDEIRTRSKAHPFK